MFALRLEEAVGSTVAATLGSVLPYSVIITNTGAVPLVGITVRFALNIDGRTVTRDFFYHSFNQPLHPVVPAGKSRLITPLKTANALAGGAIRVQGSGGVAVLSSPGEVSALHDLASAKELRVSIDLAVGADGRYAGGDAARTLDRLRKQADAYRAMRDECLMRLRRGDTDQSLSDWLEAFAKRVLVHDQQTHSVDRYIAAQKDFASSWLAAIRAGRRLDLEARLTSVTTEAAFPLIMTLKGGLQ